MITTSSLAIETQWCWPTPERELILNLVPFFYPPVRGVQLELFNVQALLLGVEGNRLKALKANWKLVEFDIETPEGDTIRMIALNGEWFNYVFCIMSGGCITPKPCKIREYKG